MSERAPTRELLQHFDALHRAAFQLPAVLIRGKDAKLLSGLWRSHPEYVRPLMARFFAERGAFQEQAGFTVGVFASQFARLLSQYLRQERRLERTDWREECQAKHNSRCTNAHFHAAMMESEAVR